MSLDILFIATQGVWLGLFNYDDPPIDKIVIGSIKIVAGTAFLAWVVIRNVAFIGIYLYYSQTKTEGQKQEIEINN